ncbi:UdgX family uracil-DNA binding protein [Komagataeibacter medellinensis]|uniref:Type-4 uracil-DNA glycosylase n=1 Tax=Komagataeibacter medellinensis (strain NBRC 3288 / BCRC 11682 / LMG 1693 / Kondo 51) TaxID=634177 RepID=G2I518_KOMMN|nr:UdgX family uracil-DNA binding protein [Komagataeibacter medellinensis]BAK83215.1 phage DNA polymerase-related protein [Komagataeibacter medellinensis NBRC 3288]
MQPVTVTLAHPLDFATWRAMTRVLVARHVPPQAITWQVAAQAGAASQPPPPAPDLPGFSILRETLRLAATTFQSMLPDRAALAYGLIYAHATGTQPDPANLERMEAAAAQVRAETDELRRTLLTLMQPGTTQHATFPARTYAPECNARFITLQLSLAPWQLSLPGRMLRWTGDTLLHGPHAPLHPLAPSTLPPPALPLVTDLDISQITSLRAVALAARSCLICPMARHATQTVFGEGEPTARMMFVGEQPGDREDQVGRPFVGPAGQLFDRALAEAGIGRADVYVTNTVKHFKFIRRGTRRIHEKAGHEEVTACAPWLAAERHLIRPRVLVMLGATAASALLGRSVTIGHTRSRPIPMEDGSTGVVTVHPSYLLRLPGEDARAREYARFVDDLRLAASHLPAPAP